MGHLLFSVDGTDLVNRFHVGAQPSMYAEDLVVHHCSQGQVIEHLSAVPPDIQGAEFAETFIVETVDLCDLT